MKHLFKTKVICLQTGTSLKNAKNLMKERRIRHLPIINDSGDVISILSKHDFSDIDKFQDLPVDLFATFPVTYVTEDTSLKKVASLMLEKKISCVLVTNSLAEVIGIITTDDLIYHLVQLLPVEDTTNNINWFSANALVTAGEFFKKLADIGI